MILEWHWRKRAVKSYWYLLSICTLNSTISRIYFKQPVRCGEHKGTGSHKSMTVGTRRWAHGFIIPSLYFCMFENFPKYKENNKEKI